MGGASGVLVSAEQPAPGWEESWPVLFADVRGINAPGPFQATTEQDRLRVAKRCANQCQGVSPALPLTSSGFLRQTTQRLWPHASSVQWEEHHLPNGSFWEAAVEHWVAQGLARAIHLGRLFLLSLSSFLSSPYPALITNQGISNPQ